MFAMPMKEVKWSTALTARTLGGGIQKNRAGMGVKYDQSSEEEPSQNPQKRSNFSSKGRYWCAIKGRNKVVRKIPKILIIFTIKDLRKLQGKCEKKGPK